MTIVDKYPGSAGGQPRLTLPYVTLDPRDPLFSTKLQAMLRTLNTWANSLLLPVAGSGLINYAKYHSNALGSPISWTLDWGDYPYVVANKIAAFPADSVSLVTYRMETASNFTVTAFPGTIGADAFSSGTIDSSFNTTDNDNPWAVSPRLSFQFDTANPYTLPITIESFAVNIATSPQQILEIWSWSHP